VLGPSVACYGSLAWTPPSSELIKLVSSRRLAYEIKTLNRQIIATFNVLPFSSLVRGALRFNDPLFWGFLGRVSNYRNALCDIFQRDPLLDQEWALPEHVCPSQPCLAGH
jgi:hypothetical protein